MEQAEEQQKRFINEKDNVFVTGTGAMLDRDFKNNDFNLASLIPISHSDVHKFIQEISEENLQLINFTNEEIEAKEKMQNANATQFDTLLKQITQTSDTIKLLNDRKSYILSKIEAMSQGDKKVPVGTTPATKAQLIGGPIEI